jgi:2'-hydroxyisoflavone reductase
VQFIDVRDLADWLVTATASGVYNVVAPPLPMAGLLAACRAAAGSGQEIVWIPTAGLLAAGVDPWMGVPLWIGDPTWRAANLVDATRARAAGLVTRPLTQTVADVLAWDTARGGPPSEPLSPADERRLLAGAGRAG